MTNKKENAAGPGGGEAAKGHNTCCANSRQSVDQAQPVEIPSDPRVLRVIMALADVMVYDQGGAEPIKSYDPLAEVLEAVLFLRRADAVTIRRACLRAMEANGDLPPRAEVIRFPEGGCK